MEEPRDLESKTPPEATARDLPVRVSSAVWTVPNVISMVRIGLIGVFGWLLVAGYDLWAVGALVAAGVSDFLDGFLARRWQQVTVLGRLLDPAADRLLTIVVVIALALRGAVPWWLVAILLARDAMVATVVLVGRTHHVSTPQVTFTGKAATAALYVFLPLAFLAHDRWDGVHVAAIIGACAAAGLYWISGIAYVRDVSQRSHSGTIGASARRGQEHLG
ncbi:CDP-alcohol phosphatidyltransferase family protein [Demequina muriae]|uniref:CDP-alcohol phosphatidyltransferase family protein n=1 Tax=Demequina muriae TaxID=3051664 RepID=A0ABT8GKD1_9MICO|nr:CDP-alcohol phosphatidyltransferase family protein [Demequina sp. EGI L300058]MDN4481731.1 CDP-alcohol phosphatidyltransferase family protein [Demequina sp. EGI L300058]